MNETELYRYSLSFAVENHEKDLRRESQSFCNCAFLQFCQIIKLEL